MSLSFIRRSYAKAKNNYLSSCNVNILLPSYLLTVYPRAFSDDKLSYNPLFSSSTILIENGLNVHELPVIVRKLKNVSEMDDKPIVESTTNSHDATKYYLIQEEFKKCLNLREVFSLLSKCSKITPNIALGAMERIYELEQDTSSMNVDSGIININVAKGAILDKLLKVIIKTEDTQTILNILNTVSSLMEPYKYKFCDELVFRVLDNKMSVEQLCEFITFLIKNKYDLKYSETIDKLWVGFVEKGAEINESNIVQIFKILYGLKASKRTIISLLENKLSELWFKINVPQMQEIINIFIQEKHLSIPSFAVVGRWLHINIHALDEDSMLDIIVKLTRLKYNDDQIEKAVEKYMKQKGSKIENHILVVGILNYCMQFQICNKLVLNACSQFFVENRGIMPLSFLKFIIYPFGYLYYDPLNSSKFWALTEEILLDKFEKLEPNDLCSMILAHLYLSKYPLKVINKLFNPEYLKKINNPETLKRLHLIDTTLSLECLKYAGPLLPKDQWSKPTSQDYRIKNIVSKTMDIFVEVAGGDKKLSTPVLIPNLYFDETYLLDVMLHPAGMGSNTFNWKSKLLRNENVAILIHLPDHYCFDNEHLIGPQMMKKRHLKILGMKVVSLKYSTLSQFYTSCNMSGFRQYLVDSINNAEACI